MPGALEQPMAVYTDVADDELRAFVALYDIGEVLSCKGIAEGVENSNFLVATERGNFILTLYEKRVARADLPFFIALMDHLAHRGVACPTPLRGRDGVALRELCGRPAAMVTFLAGMWPRRIQPFHCAGLGRRIGGAAPRRRRFPDDAAERPVAFRLAATVRGQRMPAPAKCSRASPPSSPPSSSLSKRPGRTACRSG